MQQPNIKGEEMNFKHPPKETAWRLPYQPPELVCHGLAIITLGGSPGIGDSSPTNTNPPTDSSADEERRAYEEYEDDGG